MIMMVTMMIMMMIMMMVMMMMVMMATWSRRRMARVELILRKEVA